MLYLLPLCEFNTFVNLLKHMKVERMPMKKVNSYLIWTKCIFAECEGENIYFCANKNNIYL